MLSKNNAYLCVSFLSVLMRILISWIFITSTLLVFSTTCKAQDEGGNLYYPKINYLELNMSLVSPQGFFKKNISNPLFGFEVGYLRQLKSNKPLFWGISTYYTKLNSTSATIEEILDFSLVQFDYSTSTNLLGFNGKMRFYPDLRIGKMDFYLEAQLGYKWLYTLTTKTLVSDNESSDTNYEQGSLSLTYGVSAGINYHIQDQVYLNLRANYLPGLSSAYYSKNNQNQIVSSTLDQFDLSHSVTNIIRYDLGVTFWPNFEAE
jgi:hypothetical protein